MPEQKLTVVTETLFHLQLQWIFLSPFISNRQNRQNISKDIGDWSNTIKELDFVDISKTLPTTTENVYMKPSQIDHILGCETNLNTLQNTEITKVFCDHKRIKTKINDTYLCQIPIYLQIEQHGSK